jgi:hypothetical protein
MTRPIPIAVLKSPRFLELSNLFKHVREGLALAEGLLNYALRASILICSLRSIVEPACVFNSDLVALLRPVDAVATPDELFLEGLRHDKSRRRWF